MRPITTSLYVNDGTPALGASKSLENILTNLGSESWELDENLTKSQPGDITLTLADEDGAVWAWIQDEITTLQGGVSQLYPPWVVVSVAGEEKWVGLLDLTNVTRKLASREVEIAAQDWSTMLSNVDLSGIKRSYPQTVHMRDGEDIGIGYVPKRAANGYVAGLWKYKVFGISKTADIKVGDSVTSDVTGVVQFKVEEDVLNEKYGRILRLTGWNWESLALGIVSAHFYRVASDLDTSPYYLATSAVTSGEATSVKLDTLDGLAPGDSVSTTSGTDIPVADVDYEQGELISNATIQTDLAIGDRLYFSSETQKQLVFQDALRLAAIAASPYGLDTSRYTPATLQRPLLGWLTTWNPTGEDVYLPTDVEPTLTGIRIIGQGGAKAWTGNPEDGFTKADAAGLRWVDWTTQLTAAPTSLMPDEGPALVPAAGSRNRNYFTWSWNRTQYLAADWSYLTTPAYTSRSIVWPQAALGYDYGQLRRIRITNPDSGESTYAEQRWSGSAWGTAVTGAWPVAGWHPCALAPLPGVAATSGPSSPQGCAMVALCANGSAFSLQMIWAGSPQVVSVSSQIATGAYLKPTPWGLYLVGLGGYGRISYTNGSLALTWCAVGDGKTTVLLMNTFAALDGDSVHCCARFDYADPDNQGEVLTETRLLNLTTNPQNGEDPVIYSEKVMAGTPRISVLFRDPSSPARLIGILGGRLCQVAAQLPRTVERVQVDNLSGAELLEHLGQLLNALVIPLSDGTVSLVSRHQASAPIALTVDQVEVTQSRISQHFFSVVRVSAADGDLYADASGLVKGGKALEIDSHPCVWTEGGCYAMASSYADFLGRPRRYEEQRWCHEDPDTEAPWEALAPWERITINGGSTVWFFAGLEYDRVKGEATAKLLEAL